MSIGDSSLPSNAMHNDIVMVVDDRSAVLTVVHMYLEMLGYTDISMYTDPRDALGVIEAGARPTIIISDYEMPHMNGRRFLERAKAILGNFMGIIMTGSTSIVGDIGFPVLEKNESEFSQRLSEVLRGSVVHTV